MEVLAERDDDLLVLHDRARPPVEQQQRHGARRLRSLMNEMDLDPVDRRFELVELVQPPLLGPPVVLVAPVDDKLTEVGQVGAVVPIGAGELVGKPRASQALLQVCQLALRDLDPEGHDGSGPLRSRGNRVQSSADADGVQNPPRNVHSASTRARGHRPHHRNGVSAGVAPAGSPVRAVFNTIEIVV